MKFQIVNENQIIEGNDYKEVADAIKNGSKFASEENLKNYMKGFAERYQIQTSKIISYNNASNFIKSLEREGYLQKID